MAHKFGNCPKLPSSLEKKMKASEKVGCRNSRPRRRSCGHCGELLSLKTYRRHYKKNYDTESGSWMNTTCEVSPNASHTDDLPVEVHIDGDEMLTSSSDSETSEDEVWEEASITSDVRYSFGAPQLPLSTTASSSSQTKLVTWFVGFILLFQSRYYVTDSAIDCLLKFLAIFLQVLGRFSGFIAILASKFPPSVYQLKKLADIKDNFVKYTVCVKCYSIYHLDDSFDKSGTIMTTRLCPFVEFPDHPHTVRRQPCGKQLMKCVELANNRKILYPFKVYCYNSLITTLKEFFARPEFFRECNKWKTRSSSSDTFSDIYDGKLWKEFEHVNGEPFLRNRNNFALGFALNIDWFQPYKLTTSSVGVIFLSVLNLPRSIRYKRGNLILIGLIPGPSEPTKDVNTFLKPLVEELQDLWKGVEMCINDNGKSLTLTCKGALLCVACDLPAGRKVCGFMGHSATLGCSRCLKKFTGVVGSMNYSGFDTSSWPPRSGQDHRNIAANINSCNTKQKKNALESSTGCRYSCLLDLPYFNASRMLIVDPMHNLFLGSGKKMIKVWFEKDIITPSHFNRLQTFVDKFVVPCDIGRIPRKIETGFSGFTADQLKNWIILYSIPALYGILPEADFECWRHFVLACRIFSKKSLCQSDIQLAHALILAFCRRVQSIYGEHTITPNMHMHCHLKEVILDYGPVHSFWLFAFERFNGILGNQPTNNRLIETQLMRHFLQDMLAYSYNFPEDYKNDFEQVCKFEDKSVGSLRDMCADHSVQYPSCAKRSILPRHCLPYIKEIVHKLNPCEEDISINTAFFKYASIVIDTLSYNCASKRNGGLADLIAMIHWDFSLFGGFPTTMIDSDHPNSNIRPAKINYFIKASFTLGSRDDVVYVNLAYVSWCFPHPNKKTIGKPAQIWCYNVFECEGAHSFIPTSLIKNRCAHCVSTVKDEQVLVVVPICE